MKYWFPDLTRADPETIPTLWVEGRVLQRNAPGLGTACCSGMTYQSTKVFLNRWVAENYITYIFTVWVSQFCFIKCNGSPYTRSWKPRRFLGNAKYLNIFDYDSEGPDVQDRDGHDPLARLRPDAPLDAPRLPRLHPHPGLKYHKSVFMVPIS